MSLSIFLQLSVCPASPPDGKSVVACSATLTCRALYLSSAQTKSGNCLSCFADGRSTDAEREEEPDLCEQCMRRRFNARDLGGGKGRDKAASAALPVANRPRQQSFSVNRVLLYRGRPSDPAVPAPRR